MGDFVMWPQLSSGKHELVQWPLCTVLLMDDKNFPWVVLARASHDAVSHACSRCNFLIIFPVFVR